jgi:hypothetical protein
MVFPWRSTKGVKPDALKGASPVLKGGDEETGLCRPRLVATQLECGSVCPCRQTPRASRPSTTRPSIKSLRSGPMMGRSGRRSWPVSGISLKPRNSTYACCMATGPTPWPKKGGWHRLFRPQTPEGREGHCHYRQSWLCVSACPRGSRQ